MRIGDLDTWLKVGGDAGWTGPAEGDGAPTEDQVREAFIARMKAHGLTDVEIERALNSGALERLVKLMRRIG